MDFKNTFKKNVTNVIVHSIVIHFKANPPPTIKSIKLLQRTETGIQLLAD